MTFAILRVAKLKTAGNIGGLNGHLTRSMEVPNADPELKIFNSRPIGSKDLWKDIQDRFKELDITPRKNAVLAVDHIITASPEAFNFYKSQHNDGKVDLRGNVNAWNDFQKNSMEWLIATYGKENIVNFTVHKDEHTPHIHAVITPIDSKGKLNCREFLGGRDKLSDMQTSFANKVAHLGLKRGIEGSKAIHQDVKRFYEIIKKEPEFVQEPKIEIKTPETGMFGIGYKIDPQIFAQQETERINNVLKTVTQKANTALSDAVILNSQGNVSKNNLKGLEASLNRFKGEKERLLTTNNTLAAEKKHVAGQFWELVKKVAKNEFTPELAKKMLEEQAQKRAQKQKKDQGMGM